MIQFDYKPSLMYSISIIVRNSQGEMKGRKYFETNDAGELCAWYERNCYKDLRGKRRRKKKTKNTEQMK